MILTSHIHPDRNSTQCRSRYMCLTSIQVTSHLHAAPENCISCPSRSNLKPIQVSLRVSYFHSCPASPASMPPPPPPPPSMHRFTSIHVPKLFNSCCNQTMMLASHIHPFHVSHPSRSRELLLSSILVPPLQIQVSRCVSQPNPGPTALPRLNICIPSLPRTRLTQFR